MFPETIQERLPNHTLNHHESLLSANPQEHFDYLREVYSKGNRLPIIITGIAGAGHAKQAEILRRALHDNAGVDAHMVVMDFSGHILNKLYAAAQQIPWVMDRTIELLDLPVLQPFLDEPTKQRADTTELLELLQEENPDNSLKVDFFTTYVTGAYAAAKLLREGAISGMLIEYVPDPWDRSTLQLMTSPIIAPNHTVITHDNITAENYNAHPYRGSGPDVWGLGTLSPHEFLLHPEIPTYSPPHILIEYSGNENYPYTAMIETFITSIAPLVQRKEIHLSIHSMHHKNTRDRMTKLLNSYDLLNKDHVHHYYEETLMRAIASRLDVIVGKKGDRPNIRIGKGEVPLEHSFGIVCGAYGGGHEGHNALIGEENGRGVSLIHTHPEKWWQKIKKRINEPPTISPVSYATLAPAMALKKFLSV